MKTQPMSRHITVLPVIAPPLLQKDDGKTHINIYSKGRTPLGRSLSNFAFRRFSHPSYGVFCSMEGFYYYVSTGCKVESLRRLTGLAAKKEGRKHPRVKVDNFEQIMREGIQSCYMNDTKIGEMILTQTIDNGGKLLPFVHYYEMGGDIKSPADNAWLCDEWSVVRKHALEQAGATIIKTNDGEYARFESME